MMSSWKDMMYHMCQSCLGHPAVAGTEQPILQECPSTCPIEREFCYVDIKTVIHCQARSLRISLSSSSTVGCVPQVQVHTATYCQPGCRKGVVFPFPFWHIQVLHDANFTHCLLWGWKENLLPCHQGFSLHDWKRERCHAASHNKCRQQDQRCLFYFRCCQTCLTNLIHTTSGFRLACTLVKGSLLLILQWG